MTSTVTQEDMANWKTACRLDETCTIDGLLNNAAFVRTLRNALFETQQNLELSQKAFQNIFEKTQKARKASIELHEKGINFLITNLANLDPENNTSIKQNDPRYKLIYQALELASPGYYVPPAIAQRVLDWELSNEIETLKTRYLLIKEVFDTQAFLAFLTALYRK